MSRLFLLGVALVSLTSLAHASSGNVRFSGRIVDPACTARLALAQQQLHLERCPLAAQGAEISVASSTEDGATGSSDVLATRALTMSAVHPGARYFSKHYQLGTLQQTAAASSYLVVINYP